MQIKEKGKQNRKRIRKRERTKEGAAAAQACSALRASPPAHPLVHVAHEAGPATPYRPRAHKPLTSRTRPSAVMHRTPPHQDKLTNGPPLSATQLQRRRLPHAPSTTRPGADRGAGVGPGSRTSHDPVPHLSAAPTQPPPHVRAARCARRITSHSAIRHG